MPTDEAYNEARYWFREVRDIVAYTERTARAESITVPATFATGADWDAAVAKIEAAVGAGDYIKTRDLCRDYATRAVRYCKTWLEGQRAKKAKGASA
jgi:hypothetical protein